MPFVTFEGDLSGSGVSALSGSRVFYVAWEIPLVGPTVRHPNAWDTDAVLGVGHWELGNALDSAGLISGIGFDVPHWLGWGVGQWIAPPGQVGTDFSAAIADHIRWTVEAGSVVHLYVFGDS
jgi:hypothetical protein